MRVVSTVSVKVVSGRVGDNSEFYYFFGILTMYNIRLFYLMRKEKDFLFISSISTFIWILEQQKFIHLKKYNMHPYWHLGTSIAMYKLIKTVK